jgi:hypothetical protein
VNARTPLILGLLVLLLAALTWWQLQREESGALDVDQALFPGLDISRVQSLRVDNLELDLYLRIDRDREFGFKIVDPIDYPAETGIIRRLLEICVANRLAPMVEDRASEVNLQQLQLDPPRLVLELHEVRSDGPFVHRLELGAPDIDGTSVYVRSGGRLGRTLINLETSLARDIDIWRSRSVLSLDPHSIQSFERSGSLLPDGSVGSVEPQEVALRAEFAQETMAWKASAPFVAVLDPAKVARLLGRLCGLRAETFAADLPLSLVPFGLDVPSLRYDLQTHGGEKHVLLFGRGRDGAWNVMRAESGHVFGVDSGLVLQLAAPADSLLDFALLRGPREQIEELRLVGPRGEVRLRPVQGVWQVARGEDVLGESAWRPAEPTRVDDLLTALLDFEFAAALADTPMPEAGYAAIAKVAGELQGGALARLESDGAASCLFQRTGDEIVYQGEESLLALCDQKVDELLSLQLVRLDERVLVSIRVRRGDKELSFLRTNDGLWRRESSNLEDKTFALLVDHLLNVRALEILPPPEGEGEPLLEPLLEKGSEIAVEVRDRGGETTAYRLGRRASGETSEVLFQNERMLATVRPDAWEGLAEILAQ